MARLGAAATIGILYVACFADRTGAAAMPPGAAMHRQPSSLLTVTGVGKAARVFSIAALRSLPVTTQTATYRAGSRTITDTYTGVTLWTLLRAVGPPAGTSSNAVVLHDIVVATGTDGYRAVIAMGEIDPQFGHQPDLIAYADTAGQLGTSGRDGFARLVVPGDRAGGRYVSNLARIAIIDPGERRPEPRASP